MSLAALYPQPATTKGQVRNRIPLLPSTGQLLSYDTQFLRMQLAPSTSPSPFWAGIKHSFGILTWADFHRLLISAEPRQSTQPEALVLPQRWEND